MLRSRLLSRALLGTLLVAAASGVVAQETADPSSQQELIERLQKRLAELEARVAELEAERDEEGEKAVPEDAADERPAGVATPAPETATVEEARGPFVLKKNDRLELELGGRVHRMILTVDDGLSTDPYFTDSDQGPTSFKLAARARPNEQLTVGATIELAVQQNRPFRVSQKDPDPGLDLTGRIAELTFEGARFGKVSLGRGFAAAWLAPEVDLSGTQYASLLPVGQLAPGFLFVDSATRELSDIAVSTYFVDVERLLIVDRLRYDSPRFAGVQLSGSVAADSRWDTALRTRHSLGDFTLVGGASYQHEPFAGIDRRFDGAASVLHGPSGLNLTFGLSDESLTRGATVRGYIVKLGWQADLVSLGKTAFSIDYFRNSDLWVDGDRGESMGLFAVQKWPAQGLELYTGIRRYEVDDSFVPLEPLTVVPLGVVFNF